jgi:hypothetical protein
MNWSATEQPEAVSVHLDRSFEPCHDTNFIPRTADGYGAKPMTSRMSGYNEPGAISSTSDNRATRRLRFSSILVLSAWCGIVAGLLETGITILRKRCIDLSHANGVSVHFVWLVPSVNIVLFVLIGLILSLIARRGVRGEWIASRGLATLALLPLFWAAFPRIYAPAGLLLMMGLAAKLAPAMERRAAGFARMVRLSFPVGIGLVAILGAWCWGADSLKASREASHGHSRRRVRPTFY